MERICTCARVMVSVANQHLSASSIAWGIHVVMLCIDCTALFFVIGMHLYIYIYVYMYIKIYLYIHICCCFNIDALVICFKWPFFVMNKDIYNMGIPFDVLLDLSCSLGIFPTTFVYQLYVHHTCNHTFPAVMWQLGELRHRIPRLIRLQPKIVTHFVMLSLFLKHIYFTMSIIFSE